MTEANEDPPSPRWEVVSPDGDETSFATDQDLLDALGELPDIKLAIEILRARERGTVIPEPPEDTGFPLNVVKLTDNTLQDVKLNSCTTFRAAATHAIVYRTLMLYKTPCNTNPPGTVRILRGPLSVPGATLLSAPLLAPLEVGWSGFALSGTSVITN